MWDGILKYFRINFNCICYTTSPTGQCLTFHTQINEFIANVEILCQC